MYFFATFAAFSGISPVVGKKKPAMQSGL